MLSSIMQRSVSPEMPTEPNHHCLSYPSISTYTETRALDPFALLSVLILVKFPHNQMQEQVDSHPQHPSRKELHSPLIVELCLQQVI